MINHYSVNFNSYNEKVLNYYGFWDYRCPSCNAFHSFTRHATHSRNIFFLNFGKIEESKINILCLLCKSCGETHAKLPADCDAMDDEDLEVPPRF